MNIVEPDAGCVASAAHHIARDIAGHCCEGLVDVDQDQRAGAQNGARHRQHAKRFLEALLALAQRALGLAARLQVHEGEEHAGLLADVDGLACNHHRLVPVIGQSQLGLHLRDGAAFAQPLDRQLATVGTLEHVELVHGTADDLLAHVAGHLEKALIHFDVALVTQAADHRRRRVGVEGLFKALFGPGPFARVVQDEREAVGLAVAVGQHQAANAVHPVHAVVVGGKHFDDHVGEAFTRDHALDRVLAVLQCVVVAVAQAKALAVLRDILAERLDRRDAMHLQGRLVGPENPLVGFDQDHAFGQAGDDLLELATVGPCLQHAVVHGRFSKSETPRHCNQGRGIRDACNAGVQRVRRRRVVRCEARCGDPQSPQRPKSRGPAT